MNCLTARRLFTALFLTALLSGCGAKSSPEPAPPAWFRDAMAREAELPTPFEIKSEDGTMRARVHAASSPTITTSEETHTIIVPIASDTEVACFARKEAGEAPVAIAKILDEFNAGIVAEFAKAGGALKSRETSGTAAGAYSGGQPFLRLDQLLVSSRGEAAQLKQIAAEVGNRPFWCFNGDLGYSATFGRVVEALAMTMTFSDTATENAYFRQVVRISVGDLPIGYGRERHYRRNDGTYGIVSDMSMLVLQKDGEIEPLEYVAAAGADENGNMLEAYFAVSGPESSETTINPGDKAGSWVVERTESGRTDTLRFDHARPLATSRALAKLTQKQGDAGTTSWSENLDMYDPSFNVAAAALLSFTCTLTGSAEQYSCEGTFGPGPYRSEIDGAGIVRRMQMPVVLPGVPPVLAESVFTSGRP